MSDTQKNPLDLENPIDDSTTPEHAAPGQDEPSKIIILQTELDKTKDQMLRAMAEAENARKRAVKERDDASRYAVSNFAKEMLTVADNLRRALEAVPPDLLASEPRVKNLVDGIEATQREMLKTFEQNGIRKIDPMDELFNANFHEVLFESPGTGKPPGTVVQVVDTGYILHDRLLRPARVAVAKNEGQGNGTPGSNIDTQA
jgi:molecular chaperone GrpE